MASEIEKLMEILKEMGTPFDHTQEPVNRCWYKYDGWVKREMRSYQGMKHQVLFQAYGNRISVVCGPYTYGGMEGLLEIWDFDPKNDPVGYLTAEEVIEYLKTEYPKVVHTDGRP